MSKKHQPQYIREQILDEGGRAILLVFTGAPTAKSYREIEEYAAWKAQRMESAEPPADVSGVKGLDDAQP